MWTILKLLPLAGRIGAVLGLLAALWGGYQWIRHDAYQVGKRAAEAVCVAEKASQRAANEAAADRAYEQLRAAANELIEKDKELADALAEFNEAADADSGGASGGIGVDSVRRLNSIR